MLDELAVRNLGILDEARLEPGAGLVVVTGETGAGKTMLLGALQLLLGLSARTDAVGPAGEETLVEGRFIDEGGREIIVARRIRKTGRSRAYLNGEMATLKEIEDRTRGLVEVVAQHDHLALGRQSEVRRLVDQLLSDEGRAAAGVYQTAWERLAALEAISSELGGDARALERERELASWQAEEIARAGFAPGDDAELMRRADRLRNADAILSDLSEAHRSVESAADEWGSAVASLRRAGRLSSDLESLLQAAEEVAAAASSLLTDVRRAGDGISHDPAELEVIESRLALLGDLRRKYGQDLDEVLAFGEQAERRTAELADLLDRSERISEELAEARASVETAGRNLSDARRVAAGLLIDRTVAHLQELGFVTPKVVVDFEPAEPRAHGADRLVLRFSSDERLEPAPVTRVASGGELSRLVLALRLAGGAGEAPVIAFDEIDAGVGGRTALALGRKLAELSTGRQVLVVTHLPQVAAFADVHYSVERDGTTARVDRLTESAQVDELARMLAGLEGSDQGRGHAAELRRTALSHRR